MFDVNLWEVFVHEQTFSYFNNLLIILITTTLIKDSTAIFPTIVLLFLFLSLHLEELSSPLWWKYYLNYVLRCWSIARFDISIITWVAVNLGRWKCLSTSRRNGSISELISMASRFLEIEIVIMKLNSIILSSIPKLICSNNMIFTIIGEFRILPLLVSMLFRISGMTNLIYVGIEIVLKFLLKTLLLKVLTSEIYHSMKDCICWVSV